MGSMSRIRTTLTYTILILLAFFALAPFYIQITASIKSSAQILNNPMGIPQQPKFSNYVRAWQVGDLGIAFRNSLIVSVSTVIGVSITGGMAAYALAKVKFPAWKMLVTYFFICTTLPPQLFITPLYFWFKNIGLINSLVGIILIYIAYYSPFSILLLRSYFIKIPEALEEAALVDGASRWQAFWRVIVPIAKSGFTTVAVVVGMWTWNEFLLALTFLTDTNVKTLTVKFMTFSGKYTSEWGLMMAGSIFIVAPIIFAFIFLQRRFIEGLAQSGLKA